MQNLSGLNDYLMDLFQGMELGDGHFLPSVFGDGIFQNLACIVPRYTGLLNEFQEFWNARMAALRIAIEHILGLHRNIFGVFSNHRLIRLLIGGEHWHKMTLMSFFMLNCYNCLNQTSSNFFGLPAPSLAWYLPLDEDIPVAPTVSDGQLGTVYDYGNV
jgi:hypothetical protein